MRKRTLTVTCRYEPDELADKRLSDVYGQLIERLIKRKKENREKETNESSELICKSFIEEASTRRNNRNSSTYVSTPNQPTPGSVPNGKASDQPIPESVSDRRAPKQSVKSSVADYEYDFTVGVWNGTAQRSSASSVQEDPRSKITDVLNERAARGNGNAPLRS